MQRVRHTLAHAPNKKLEGGHFSLVTLSDAKDTQISVMSVTLRAEEVLFRFVSFFF